MTDQSNCPRCDQRITFRKDGFTIYPHRDNRTREPCPMGGVEIGYARKLVERERERIREMAR